MDYARRRFIGATPYNKVDGSVNLRGSSLRPPWSLAETHFLDACTRCNACINVCPEGILRNGGGEYPIVDFTNGECSFCEACVTVCNDNAFSQPRNNRAWQHVASATNDCLARNGISCQSCQDSCEPRAITFTPRIGEPSRPEFNSDDCTGCGACVSVCPNNAISFTTAASSSIPVSMNTNQQI